MVCTCKANAHHHHVCAFDYYMKCVCVYLSVPERFSGKQKCLACGVSRCYKSLMKLKPNSESVFYKTNNLKVQQTIGRFSVMFFNLHMAQLQGDPDP